MNTKHLKKSLSLSLISIAIASFLNACTVTSDSLQHISDQQAFDKLDLKNINYEQIDTLVTEDSKFNALILKTRYYIVKKDYDKALTLIKELKIAAKTPVQNDHLIILEASIAQQNKNSLFASQILNTVNKQTLENQVAIYYYQLLSKVNFSNYLQSKDPSLLVQAFNAKKELFNLVNDNDKILVLKQSIDLLKDVGPQDLSFAISRTNNEIDKGYLEYALIDQSKSPALREKLLKSWSDTYKDHPIKTYLINNQILDVNNNDVSEDGAVTKASSLYQLQDKDQVAVLLPLTGRFANNVGKVAKLGVLSAVQDRRANITVKFYDTNTLSMDEIVKELEANNTKFIIGPILQPEVDALANTNNKIPAIAFNTPKTKNKNIFYFDLGADYEGKTVAAKIFSQNHTNPVIIASNSEKAKQSIKGFSDVWLTTNNKIANICYFNTAVDARDVLSTCDITNADSVYIIGSAREASAVYEKLPKNLSTYVSDSSFEGLNNSGLEMSLNGAYITDMPYLLTDSPLKSALLKEMDKVKPQSQRIFAASYDAVNVAFNIKNIDSNSNDVLHGLSGDIELSNHLLHRSPMWLKIGAPNIGRF